MDKIKIFTAVLALAGCMENGFGMQENIEINGNNVVLKTLNFSEFERKLNEECYPNIESVTFDNIDFSQFSVYQEQFKNFMEFKESVIFNCCQNFPNKLYGIELINNVTFINCDMSLEKTSCFLGGNCLLGYLNSLVFYNSNTNMSIPGPIFNEAKHYFKFSATINGQQK